MTAQELEQISIIHHAISAKILENGSLKLSQISKLFLDAGIDRSIYLETGPKKWLTDNFPEFFIEGSNGKETIVPANDALNAIDTILKNTLRIDGKMLLSFVPRLLSAHGYQYKDYAAGQRLSEWITNQFPDLKKTEDNLWLVLVSQPVPEPIKKDCTQEIQQMHAVSFMNWWGINLKKLRSYNPQLTSEDTVKASVAHGLALAMLGKPNALVYVEEEHKAVFKTGLKNSGGEPIYCILVLNPKNDDGSKQMWALSDFACANDDTPTGLWLRGIVDDDTTQHSFSALRDAATKVENSFQKVTETMANYYSVVSIGKMPPVRMSEDICAFEKLIDDFVSLYENVLGEKFPSDQTIAQIGEQMSERDSVSQQIKNAVDMFCNIAERVHQLILNNRCPINGSSTPQKDIMAIRKHYSDCSPESSLDFFEELLPAYQALLKIMSSDECTYDIEVLIESVVCKHFTEITYRNAVRMLVGSERDEWYFLEVLDTIEQILSNCRSKLLTSSSISDREEMSSVRLLEKVMSCANDGILLSQYARHILPENMVEKMLVLSQIDELEQYLKTHDDTRFNIDLAAKIAEQELPKDLTYYSAAVRLQMIIGDFDGIAEKYFILALALDANRSANALLDLYRKNLEKEKFAKVFTHFAIEDKISIENRTFYLSVLCDKSGEAALEYANAHYYMFYHQESAHLLCSLSDEVISLTEKISICKRNDQLSDYKNLNGLEEAILSGDYQRICAFVDNTLLLSSFGYSEEQITRIVQVASKAQNIDQGSDLYSIGRRFFQYQKNTHGLAERYMWSGIAADQSIIGLELMLLLAQESRFKECCSLYECYQKSYSKNPGCRRLYLLSRLRADSVEAKDYIRNNLQDTLVQIHDVPLVKSTIAMLAKDDSGNADSFYVQLMTLSELLNDTFIKAVVLLDRTLREYSTPSYMKGLAIEEKYVNSAISVYKSDNYAHGADALSIASRIFAFCGTYANAAESFAKFALPDMRAVNLLCELYAVLEDDSLLFELLQDYPQLRNEHKELYLNGLFQRQLYAEYISEYKDNSNDCAKKLQFFIATLKINPSAEIVLPDVSCQTDQSSLDGWFASWGGLLFSTLINTGRMEDVEYILFLFFDGWLSRLPNDTVRCILTCNGAISSEVLAAIQDHAVSLHQDEIALYIFSVLKIGELDGVAEQFLEKEFALVDSLTSDKDRLKALLRMKAIFGEKVASVNEKISLLEISQILKDDGLALDETVEKVTAVVNECVGKEAMLNELFALLGNSKICYDHRVCKGIESVANSNEAKLATLTYFHTLAVSNAEANSLQFKQFVCQQYVNAFVNDYFPLNLSQEAYDICYSFVVQTKNVVGRFCLYFLEAAIGRKDNAKLILRELADLPSAMIGEEVSNNLTNQLSKLWKNNLPSYLTLFKEVLEEKSLPDIVEFISYAGSVSEYSGESISHTQTQLTVVSEELILSEMESDELIRLLYVNSRDDKTWNLMLKLPLQDSPLCYAKIQILVAERTPGLWEKCATYCEKYEQSELLLTCLTQWTLRSPLDKMNQCREFLEKRITDNPDYLSRWNNAPNMQLAMLKLSKTLCDRLNPAEAELHATMRSISLIAEKTGVPEALDYLLTKHSGTLLGRNCNLAVVTVAYLLLDKRFEEASEWLSLINGVLGNMNYRGIMIMLAGMDRGELESWTSKSESEILLQLILPDGNRPSIDRIAAITYNGIIQNKELETANVLLQMLEIFPDDYGIYNSLYDVCCTKFSGYLPILHKALRGLVRLSSSVGAQFFYRRKQDQYVRMLAVLDAVIITKKLTSEISGYSFAVNTGDYYRKVGAANTTPSEVLAVNAVREKAINQLLGLNSQAFESASEAYIGCITGNWRDFLLQAWNQRRDIRLELELAVEKVEDIGFARSMLYVISKIEPSERLLFVQWIKDSAPKSNHHAVMGKTQRQAQIDFVVEFLSKGGFDRLCLFENTKNFSELIDSPFEDYSLMPQYFSKYIDSAITHKAENLYDIVFLIGALVCREGFQSEVLKAADELFDDGNDLQASQLYQVLCDLNRIFALMHVGQKGNLKPNRVHEQYEARFRITSLFSGEREIAEKVASPDFHVWSCINLVLSLIYSRRANEVLRLATYFSEENATLAKALLIAMDRSVNDQEKLKLVDTLPDDVMRAYFCYVVKYPYNPANRNGAITNSFCLTDRNVAAEFNHLYLNLAKKLMDKFGTKYIKYTNPSHVLLVEKRPIHINASTQKNLELWVTSEKEECNTDVDVDLELPFFAEDLESIIENVDIAALIQEYEQIPRLSEHIFTKRDISKKVLQCSLTSSDEARTDALLLYGCDTYYASLATGDIETAKKIVFALAKVMKHGDIGGYGFQEARTLLPNGLYSIIHTFGELSKLLESYIEHRTLYFQMLSCISDPLISSCVSTIFEVLDNLKNLYLSADHENLEVLRGSLASNYLKLETIEANRWMELKNKVQKLINDEIYELDRRPMLPVEVHNIGIQRNTEYLHGTIRNIGQVAAESIILQANYGNNGHSQQYILDCLSPGSQAVFKIDYSCTDETDELNYYVNLSFMYDGKLFSSVACKGTLQVGSVPAPNYPIISEDPNGLLFSINEETGEVFNPNFVGRKSEISSLTSLLAGNDFTEYKSAMVYGIRRSGKSTLLNYLSTYIEANFEDVICLHYDCQTLVEKDCVIQYLFVDYVLGQVEARLPELSISEEWEALKQRWGNKSFCADQNMEDLTLFYPAVKRLIGNKGIYFIIDEIDRLFEKIEESQYNLDNLFGTISAMLTLPQCRKAVHFVICGSNWLIRYNLRGDTKNQLLQRFGEQVIEVGKLPEADAKEVVIRPYREYPELSITQEAFEWIWNYTGGLVWHTKLLGNKSVQRAKESGRYVVYPSDVRESVPMVITELWCKQFYEGFESGNEFKLVDAMQSLTSRCDAYVHVSKLCELLQWEAVEVQKCLSLLTALKVVSPDPVDSQKYRFEMDIYRRFFRSQPSAYQRIPEEADMFRKRHVSNERRTVQSIAAIPTTESEVIKPISRVEADNPNYDPQDNFFGNL